MNAVEEVANQLPYLVRLLPRRKVSGLSDDFQFTASDILLHQFCVRQAGQHVFIPRDNQSRDIDGLQRCNESGRSAMPRCTPATSSGDIRRIIRRAPSTRSGREWRVVSPINFGSILSKNGSVPR